MCYGTNCPTCSKKSWRGCGSHIPSALAGVPEDQWCTCEPKVDVGGTAYPPQAESEQLSASVPAWMKRWTGSGESKKDDL